MELSWGKGRRLEDTAKLVQIEVFQNGSLWRLAGHSHIYRYKAQLAGVCQGTEVDAQSRHGSGIRRLCTEIA